MNRPSTLVPTISAHAHLHGQYDYTVCPLATLGCAVEMHMQPDVRDTFATHSVSVFNVGTSLEHCRCYNIWVYSVGLGNTIFFMYKHLKMPTLTDADALLLEVAKNDE